ncbi:MAG: transglycosylase SLT domain-containing protein [Bryobacteraceae bacterium]|nr:transglycosylase SLT domain-containing protein [Bryobacteraceae bacterium]
MSFLPPAPRNTLLTPIEAPVVEANPYLRDSSFFLKPSLTIPPRPSQVDSRIRRAEERFQNGKRLLNFGDAIGARSEFDIAVDLLLALPEDASNRHKAEAKLEQLVAEIHKFDVNRLGAGDLSSQVAYDRAPLEEILDMTFPVDPGLKPRVREQVQATVSQLPLEMNDSVLSYINYFSSEKGRRTLIAGLKRAGRYRPLISRILAEEGVPQELIYLAQAESGFLPRAVSHKAAVGMWQFVQYRGREYGLMQTPYHDDRLDPEKATRSAARHLRDLYTKFGDWYLAIAGYNCGDGCVDRAVRRTGYADFWKVRSLNAIPRETTNYVPIILAMTIMHKNAKDYGLEGIEPEPALVYQTVRMDAPTHLGLLADAADRPISEIRDLNPALLSSVAPMGYELRVPNGTSTQVTAALGTIPAERRASWRIHRVNEGDTLESIARRFSMPVSALTSANNVSEAELGEVLVIPTASQIERIKVAKSSVKQGSVKLAAASKAKGKTTLKAASLRNARATSRRISAARPAHRRIASR